MLPTRSRSSRLPGGAIFVVILLFLIAAVARTFASWVLDYQWWQEMGQLPAWVKMMLYGVGPAIAAGVVAFIVFWAAHARGMKAGGTRLSEHPLYARVTTLALIIIAIIFGSVAVDSWTVVRYFGGHGLSDAAAWRDPVFGNTLSFYLFDLPFYSELLRIVLALCVIGALIYWVARNAWSLRSTFSDREMVMEITNATFSAAFESRFFRFLFTIFLLALAVWVYLDRYSLLSDDHGFMVGADWVAVNVTLPLMWLSIAACIGAAALMWTGMRRWAVLLIVLPILVAIVPRLVNTLYVKPNEISIQKPYIHQHIEATRSAYGLNQHTRERDFPAKFEARIDVQKNRALLDNIRLWDWRAFHDTVSQVQPLRPYTFSDTDVDRYDIDGQMRQVLLSPRELDLNQLGDAGSRWINPHFVYTHGYGLVMAEANHITPNGLPVLFIRDAPPEVLTKSLKLTRPELYYGEEVHEPVFVRTEQPEFNYPSGADNVHTRYAGTGGFPISSLPMRLNAAVAYGDWNILLTSQLPPQSRMMIHRSVLDRLHSLAGFVQWDADPYLVLSADGRLFWIVDGYLTSQAHPYSREVSMQNMGRFNYIRNSVKATVDAYNGSVKLYVFDPSDPLIRAYQNLFPTLFTAASEMPADLRAHARFPETIFRAQAEIYRRYHMRDPEAFYNNADLWDIARWVQGQESQPQSLAPTYVIATLPGEAQPEFLLMVPFTPRNKDNLIGLMMARCDGEHLGEINVLLLSKQEVLLGPMQVEARINQDQTISKDLTLWNQQGSGVLRGQMLVLPVDNTFLYVEPIYIQAKEARMPQMKKVVVAVGNALIYTDTYEQALAQLGSINPAMAAPAAAVPAVINAITQAQPAPSAAVQQAPQQMPQNDTRIQSIRDHLRRYRELASQGKWAEAGKELETIESLVNK
jgi:uncharacterized protein